MTLKNRNLLKLLDFTAGEIIYLLDLSESLKRAKQSKTEEQFLKNKNIALIFEKTSTRTRCAFETACYDQGAHVTFLGPGETQIGHKETMKDTARVLGRMYDGIQYRGFSQDTVEELAKYAGVPVWNGLTNQFHPTQVLADLLTMREFAKKALSQIKFCYLGDARNNMANSLLSGSAIMGMDFRIAAPPEYTPSAQLREQCEQISQNSGAKILITSNIEKAVENCDFLYTDVWVSMGEPKELWAERISKLMPYSVTEKVLEMTNNPDVKFLHCLPAFHNRFTQVGEEIFRNFGIDSMEVTDDVFEGDASVVFEQAENRLHTIKAVMVATMT